MSETKAEYGTAVSKFEERAVVPEPTPERNSNQFIDTIERLAANPNVDVAKIKQILDMQTQILDRNAKQAFNAAMTRTQNKIELVVAKSKNEQTHSSYAKLKAVLLSAKPIYTSEGFSLMFYEGETTKENHKRVGVDIMHTEGHVERRYGDFAIQTKGIAGKTMMTLIHGQGSAFSYGRRYLTCMIFNIPTGDDDDGNACGAIYISYEMAVEINAKIKSTGTNLPKFLQFIGAEKIEDILISDYGKAVAALAAKEQKNKAAEKVKDREPEKEV